jgi:hypothetical protein
MAAGFALRARGGLGTATAALAMGGLLSALGAYTFAYLLWRTLDGPAALRDAARRAREAAASAPARGLPLAGRRDGAQREGTTARRTVP